MATVLNGIEWKREYNINTPTLLPFAPSWARDRSHEARTGTVRPSLLGEAPETPLWTLHTCMMIAQKFLIVTSLAVWHLNTLSLPNFTRSQRQRSSSKNWNRQTQRTGRSCSDTTMSSSRKTWPGRWARARESGDRSTTTMARKTPQEQVWRVRGHLPYFTRRY